MDKKFATFLPRHRKTPTDPTSNISSQPYYDPTTVTSVSFPQSHLKNGPSPNLSHELLSITTNSTDTTRNQISTLHSGLKGGSNPVKQFGQRLVNSSIEKAVQKKLKFFMDHKASFKLRFNGLKEYSETISDYDLPGFYTQYGEQVIVVVHGYFFRQVQKIKQKGSASINSKEVLNLVRTYPLLRQVMIHCSETISQGWQEENIVSMLTQLLHYGNAPNLRESGFELLLVYMAVIRSPLEGPLWLYRNTIPLDVYLFDRLDGDSFSKDILNEGSAQMGQDLIHADDRTPLVPSPEQSSHHHSNKLLSLILKNLLQLAYVASGTTVQIEDELDQSRDNNFPPTDFYLGMGIERAKHSLTFMYTVFQSFYLNKLLPSAKDFTGSSTNENPGYQQCPPSVLNLLVIFLVRNCLDDSFKAQGINLSSINDPYPPSSPACPILKKTLFSTPASRYLLDHILSQSLALSQYGRAVQPMETVRGAILIIAGWLIGEENEKPLFLRGPPQSADSESEAQTNSHPLKLHYLNLLKKCLNFKLKSTQLDTLSRPVTPNRSGLQNYDANKPDFGISSELSIQNFSVYQQKVYQEVLATFRAVINLEDEGIKLHICHSLLEVNEILLSVIDNNPNLILSKATGKFLTGSTHLTETLDQFFETLMYGFSMISVKDKRLWLRFQVNLSKSTIFSGCIKHWGMTLKRVTRNLCCQLYDVDLKSTSPDLGDLIRYGTVRTSRSGVNKVGKRDMKRHPTAVAQDSIPTEGLTPSPKSSLGRRNTTQLSKSSRGPDDNPPNRGLGFYLLSDYFQFMVAPTVLGPNSLRSSASHSRKSSGQLSSPSHSATSSLTTSPQLQLNDATLTPDLFLRSTKRTVMSHPELYLFSHTLTLYPQSQPDLTLAKFPGNSLIFVWKNFLCGLGNIHAISNHDHYERALRHIIAVYDGMVQVRTIKAPLGPPVPCAAELTGWILADLDRSSISDHLSSLEWLCRCLCSRRCHDEFIQVNMPLIFRVLLAAIQSPMSRHFRAVLIHGTCLFSRGIPGINLLAPTALKSLTELLLESKPNSDEDDFILQNAMQMVGSILGVAYQFTNLDIPLFSLNSSPTSPKMVVTDQMRDQILSLLLRVLDVDDWSSQLNGYPTTYAMAINNLALLITYELSGPGSVGRMNKAFTAILHQLDSKNFVLANTSLDCLTALAMVQPHAVIPEWLQFESMLEDTVNAIHTHLNLLKYPNSAPSRDHYLITRLYSLVLDWVRVAPHHILSNSQLIDTVISSFVIGMSLKQPIIIRESCQIALYQLIHQFQTYNPNQPFLNGSSFRNMRQWSGGYSEGGEEEGWCLVSNKMTLIKMAGNQLDVRDGAGRFGYDVIMPQADQTKRVDQLNEDMISAYVVSKEELECLNDEPLPQDPYEIEFEDPPAFDQDEPLLRDIDMLGSALDFVEGHFKDKGRDNWIRTESQPTSDYIQAEEDLEAHVPKMHPLPTVINHPELTTQTMSPPKVNFSPWLLDQIGMLELSDQSNLTILNGNSDKALKGLDRVMGRDTIKLGALFINTEHQDPLTVTKPSAQYLAFLSSLAWPVQLQTHQGYLGGLERTGTNGTHGYYYSDFKLEMIVHDPTSMPTLLDDPNQLRKKRHLGNDPVLVVWNEGVVISGPYRLGGDFGNAQIHIYPRDEAGEVLEIRVIKDKQVDWFGPLHTGMVVTRAQLPDLVRATCVNAYKAILAQNLHYNLSAFQP